jgi:hypothetical protein
MSDLSDMIRQRDQLDRQIQAAQEQADSAYTAALDRIREAVTSWAQAHGHSLGLDERKNVETLIVGDLVSVAFGYPRTGSLDFKYSGSLAVTWGTGSRAEFQGPLPPPAGIVALVQSLFGTAAETTGLTEGS